GDLAIQGPNAISVFRGDGDGNFTLAQTLTPDAPGQLAPAGGGHVQPATALLNQDFYPDLITVSPRTNEVLVYLGKGDVTFSGPDRYGRGGSMRVAVVAGALPAAGLPDLAVGHRDGTVTFFQGLPGGKFLARPDLTLHGLGSITGLAVGNFDGDSDNEI